MTMRRKNLASHNLLLTIYGAALALGGLVANPEFARGSVPGGVHAMVVVAVITNAAAVLRTGPRLPLLRPVQDNKFVLWIVLYIVLETVLRPRMAEPLTRGGAGVLAVSYAALLGNGLYKFLQDDC